MEKTDVQTSQKREVDLILSISLRCFDVVLVEYMILVVVILEF